MSEQEPKKIDRRTLFKQSVAMGATGIGFFGIGEGVERFSRIDEKLKEAQNEPDPEVRESREMVLRRMEAGAESWKVFGTGIAACGLITVFQGLRQKN